ncbi:hypothetical protein, partial [Geminocystis sp. GBBB08]|uniref:hypothetical protein n=1 Tax=Geminocystis sp. GBBB08 TaxID=2604140 RepID=UPI0027E39129
MFAQKLQESQELIQRIIQLNYQEDKKAIDRLIYQLYQIIDDQNLEFNLKLELIVFLVSPMNREQPIENLIRGKLLTKMIMLIDHSKKFHWIYYKIPQKCVKTKIAIQENIYENEIYKDIYKNCCDEAISKTKEYLCKNPHNYNPEEANVITWLNNHLEYRLLDELIVVLKEIRDRRKNLTDNTVVINDDEELVDIFDTDKVENPHDSSSTEETIILFEKIIDLTSSNPQLQKIRLTSHPHVTAAEIIRERLLDKNITWNELCEKYNVKKLDKETGEMKNAVSTLSSFYEDKCRPMLIELLIASGYEKPDTPLDPIQHIKSIINKNKNIENALKEWINTENELVNIFLKNKSDLTAKIFLLHLLEVATNTRLQTNGFVQNLGITVS